jgi:hypothetical protein
LLYEQYRYKVQGRTIAHIEHSWRMSGQALRFASVPAATILSLDDVPSLDDVRCALFAFSVRWRYTRHAKLQEGPCSRNPRARLHPPCFRWLIGAPEHVARPVGRPFLLSGHPVTQLPQALGAVALRTR